MFLRTQTSTHQLKLQDSKNIKSLLKVVGSFLFLGEVIEAQSFSSELLSPWSQSSLHEDRRLKTGLLLCVYLFVHRKRFIFFLFFVVFFFFPVFVFVF